MDRLPKHVPVYELARRLSCSRQTVRRLLRDGKIPGVKVGRDWRVDPEQVILALSQDLGRAK